MSTLRSALLAALLITVPTAAQQASYTYFGSSCLTLDLTARSLPRLGQLLQLEVPSGFRIAGSGGSGTSWLFTGASNRSFGGVPLPLDISFLSNGSTVYCGALLTSCELMTDVPRINNSLSRAVLVAIPIPNDPSLLGVSLYQQVLHTAGFSQWFAATTALGHGGHAVIGL